VEFRQAVAELDALVRTLEREGDERALLLLELVDAIHRPALQRIVEGRLDDPCAAALLAMYDLAPVDPRVLAEEALDDIRPYIESHGGAVELLDVHDGVVHLRLSGACDGCAGSTMTLSRGVEAALREHLPGFERVELEPAERPLLQIADLRRPVFVDVGSLDGLAPGALRAAAVEGVDVLMANVDGEVFAFRDGCAVDGLSLQGGRLTGSVLVCPWHNCAYDARSGRRLDEAGAPGLRAIPMALVDGTLKVAVNVA
jgi:Fe-S cluster biogenesis protein NfuA/nitrite reductase/ring-hydroxylating ferredoxin subunit